MKRFSLSILLLSVVFLISACTEAENNAKEITTTQVTKTTESTEIIDDGIVDIELSDTNILVEGNTASEDSSSAVYIANDIVYYEEGKDFTYGEGTNEDAHSALEAAAHTVVHITKAGEYKLSGKLSKGQIAVDLGEDAKKDPDAVVTLVLSDAEITCQVAPAVIFYNVYECSDSDADSATRDVDTSLAGANVIIADGTENVVNGSYVARIYKPDSVVLSEDGTEVEDASKLHKYDGAFYSKMSMNINGGQESTGVLTINAENEGLDSELHLTINGGNIVINSGNDGINTNEDGVSVTTINGGKVHITVTGETGEGDGIDSNGWLVINAGEVCASACSVSADAGIDSDMGIYINGGVVKAGGGMLDRIEDNGQTYVVLNFRQKQSGGSALCLKKDTGEAVADICMPNDFSVLIYSSPDLSQGTYNLFSEDEKLLLSSGGMQGIRPEGIDENMTRPEMPEGMEPPIEHPEDMEPPMDFPEGMERPEGFSKPEGMEPPDMNRPFGSDKPDWQNDTSQEASSDFEIKEGANMFSVVSP